MSLAAVHHDLAWVHLTLQVPGQTDLFTDHCMVPGTVIESSSDHSPGADKLCTTICLFPIVRHCSVPNRQTICLN